AGGPGDHWCERGGGDADDHRPRPRRPRRDYRPVRFGVRLLRLAGQRGHPSPVPLVAPPGGPAVGSLPLLGRRETRSLLARHGLRPRTSLGQHFLVDPNTIRKIVRAAAVAPGELLVEVGAGVAALTVALAGE